MSRSTARTDQGRQIPAVQRLARSTIMSTANEARSNRLPIVTSEVIAAAVKRAHRERNDAFWAMLQAIFGRPEHRGKTDEPRPARHRDTAGVISFAGRA
jgi:hypothetical protein